MINFIKYYLLIAIVILAIQSCKVKSDLPDPLEAGWKGHKVCEVIEDNNQARILKCTFPPGVGHEKHRHQRHFGYTLAGSTFKMIEENGTRELVVPTGYHYYKGGITVHSAVNIGDSTAVFLIIEPK